jgi:4-amino-4-deoxy-L-arabinose transferase-like glycosyltransferase
VPAAKATETAPLAWTHPSREPDYRVWLIVGLGALIVLRLLAVVLAKTDLFFDEAQYWSWSRDLAFGYFSKPPLIAWIIRGTTSVCGNGEWCVRAAAPILYAITAAFVFLAAHALYDDCIGFWSAIVFATLPGVAFSSGLISTDVPLLACWSIALFGWIRLVQSRRMADAILMGAGLGLGLLAKYAAIYFLLCAALDAWRDKEARSTLHEGRGLAAGTIALAVVAPNLLWNATHGFATFSHTAANARWRGAPIHVGAAVDFLGAQFGIFGPILFAAFIVIAWAAFRRGCEQPECRLLAFSLPMLMLITMQALFSRALANWAAVAYPAAAILVTAVLLGARPRLFRISLGLHLVAALVIALTPVFAPDLARLGRPTYDPLVRVLGWREVAAAAQETADMQGAKAILTDDREATAEFLYYLRNTSLPVVVWPRGPTPLDHFEMTRPYTSSTPQPLLYVTLRQAPKSITEHFSTATMVGQDSFPTVAPARMARFYLLAEPQP